MSLKAGNSGNLGEFLWNSDQNSNWKKQMTLPYFIYPIECDFLDIIVIEKSSAHDEMIVG